MNGWSRVVATIAGLAWVAVACNGSEVADTEPAGSGPAPTAAATPTTTAAEEISPLAALLGPEWASHEISLPDAGRIEVSFEPGDIIGRATVTGVAGAVPPEEAVIVFDQQLGALERVESDSQGAFEVQVDALPESHVFIRTGYKDEGTGVLIAVGSDSGSGRTGTIGAGRMDATDSLPWVLITSLDLAEIRRNEPVAFDGQVRLPYSANSKPTDTILHVMALMLTDSNGRQVGYGAEYVSSFLTPTGLPIERSILAHKEMRSVSGPLDVIWRLEGETWVADIVGQVTIPSAWSAGLYRLTADLQTTEIFFAREEFARVGLCCEAPIGNFEIGVVNPPRLATTLFADVIDEGARGGIRPIQQAEWFDISPRIVARHDPVIPRADVDNRPWSYSLAPYFPMFGAIDRSPPAVVPVSLDYSKSELMIDVTRPDGGEDRLGPAPLSHLAFRVPTPPDCYSTAIATGGHLSGLVQAGASGNEFTYEFPMDGDYLIKLSGAVTDFDGRRFDLAGDYRATVGRPLKLGMGFLPATPFEVGDDVPLSLQVWPTVPATVEYSVLHVQADGTREVREFGGVANESGRWDGAGEGLSFDSAGEFRVDVEARYQEPDGDLWVGRLRTGSVVASTVQEIRARGRRGIGLQGQWFFRPDYDPPIGMYGVDSGYKITDEGLMWPPYANGDVQWGGTGNRGGEDAVSLRGSAQIVDGTSRLAKEAADQFRHFGSPLIDGLSVEEQITIGQMPLVTYADGESGLIGMQSDEIGLWAYMYSAAQRPDVRVREMLHGSDVSESYWRFDDPYYLQSGVGPEGDLPGDFKFLYGAAVIHDRVQGEATYAIYGSSWVLTPDGDPLGVRVFPPFQGASGGPNGGPLFTLHEREIDMFFTPLGVRPGTIMNVGEVFQMAGPLMPTLPSLVSYTITAPSGVERQFEGRANAVGFFYQAADDFVIDEPGLWTVDVTVMHDGMTSAGKVEEPYPTGGVLSPDGTSYTFIAVDEHSRRLHVSSDLEGLPAAEWHCNTITAATFEALVPDDAVIERAHVSVSMPGTVLVEVDLPVVDGRVRWDLDANELNRLVENFDVKRGLADMVIVTFNAEGTIEGEFADWIGQITAYGTKVVAQPFV